MDREPDGYLMAHDPDTGERSPLAVWLPDGVTAEDIGVELEVSDDD